MSATRRWLTGALLGTVFFASHVWAGGELALRADIPVQPLASALAQFGEQTGLQLIYESALVDAKECAAVRAGTAAGAALTQLLRDSRLRFEFLNPRTVRIFAPASLTAPRAGSTADTERSLEEIIVTASRLREPLGKVPLDVSVWSTRDMQAAGVRDIAQLAALTPDFAYAYRTNTGGDLYSDSAIRGVSRRHSATVAVYLDDVQIPPLRVGSYLRSYPALLDLDRVEVISGPQGALYGSYAQGGALHFITAQPDLSNPIGNVHAEFGTRGGDPTYEADSVVGIPLVPGTVGLRISGQYRHEGGYVDRVDGQTGAILDRDANRSHDAAARIGLTLRLRDNVDLSPAITYQSVNAHDGSTFATALSDPAHGVFRDDNPQARPFNGTMAVFSLRTAVQLSGFELAGVAAHIDQRADAELSWTGSSLFGGIFLNGIIDPNSGWRELVHQRTDSAEVRLSSADDQRALRVITGLSVSESHATDQVFVHFMGSTQPPVGVATRHQQASWFGQLEDRIGKRLHLTAGVRVGWSDVNATTQGTPLSITQDARGFWYTPRLVLSFQPDDHHTVFASASKGYGNPGIYPSVPLAYPTLYPRDEIWGYELGYKADLANQRLRVGGSLFYLTWDNGQQTSATQVAESTPIPGPAHSEGLDLSLSALLPYRISLDFVAAFTKTVFKQASTPPDFFLVRQGDASDQSPGITSVSISQPFQPGKGVRARWKIIDIYDSGIATHTYLENPASQYALERETHEPGNRLDLRTEFEWPAFTLGAFITNALDAHPLRQTDFFNAPSYAQTSVPRTVGLSATWLIR